MNDDKGQLHLRLSAPNDATIPPAIEAEVIRALAELLLAVAATVMPERGEGFDDE